MAGQRSVKPGGYPYDPGVDRQRGTLRGRVLTAMLAVTVVAVVAFGVPLGVAQWRDQRARAVLRLEEEASRLIATVPDERLSAHSTLTFPQTLLGDEPVPLQVGLYAASGRLVSGSGPARSAMIVDAAKDAHLRAGEEARQLVVVEPLPTEQTGLQAIRLGVPMSSVNEELRESAYVMAVLALAVTLLSAAVAFLLARRLTRPLEELADAARRLGNGDFTVRTAGPRRSVVEIDDLRRALDATAARLGDLVRRERAFAADASHQMRTPLTALRINLESAPLTPGADLSTVSAEAVAELDRLERTVEHLLAVARDVEPPAAPLDVPGLLADAGRRWQRRAHQLGRRLDVECEEPLPPVRGSEAGLSHALDVLLDNAFTHGAGTVTVSGRGIGGGVVLQVHDEGPGVRSPEADIFRRRGDAAAGHGIGLALARSLVEADGGRLELSHAGPGPVFRIVMPADRLTGGEMARSAAGGGR